MSSGIRVDSRELERALGKLAEEVAAMPEAWAAVGEELLPAVRERTPVRSGTLRDSWQSSGAPGRATIGSDEPYAGVVEAVNGPVAGALAASERTVTETLEREVGRAAGRIGFEVRS